MKRWLQDFPTHNGSVVLALCLIALTGLIVCVRLIRGANFPDGYDTWIWALIALAGVNAAGLGIKRATDASYKAAGTPTVETKGSTTVNVEAEATGPAKPVLTREDAQAAADAYAGAAEPKRTDDESGP